MLKPVCVTCKCFYRPHRNGYAFIEGMPSGNAKNNIRGRRNPKAWKPYKVWMGDLWKCPDCDHEIVVGVIAGPISEHFKPDFDEIVKATGAARLQVNDC